MTQEHWSRALAELSYLPCLCCSKESQWGAVYTVRNLARMLCSDCAARPHVPLFVVSDLQFGQIAPPPASPPNALCDWKVERTEVIGMPASGVRVVWRCEVVA